jgi:hypothetical protein
MAKQRHTSPKVGREASAVLRGKGNVKGVKASAASALSQRAPKSTKR